MHGTTHNHTKPPSKINDQDGRHSIREAIKNHTATLKDQRGEELVHHTIISTILYSLGLYESQVRKIFYEVCTKTCMMKDPASNWQKLLWLETKAIKDQMIFFSNLHLSSVSKSGLTVAYDSCSWLNIRGT